MNYRWLRFCWVYLCCLVFCNLAYAEWHSETRSIMGTEVSVTLWHSDPALAKQAIAEVMVVMQDIDSRWNPHAKGSELYRVNRLAGAGPVDISAELAQVVARALYFSELTDGVFDISFASVGRYYDYRAGLSPDAEQRREALLAVNYRQLMLNEARPGLQFGHPEMQIDLGGIAKGYAVDQAIEKLRAAGIEHASVSAGGDTRLLGDRRGRPWVVGIRNPRQRDDVALMLPLQDIAFSTSGDYERYFIDSSTGERVHHIINPRTGVSASEVMSASVMGPSGFDTDPLSTTVFILGVERGLALINSLVQYDAVIIDVSGKVYYSDGLVQ